MQSCNGQAEENGASPDPGGRGRTIGPLAALPLFMPLAGRPVLVAGDSDAAAWKAELLAAAGAEVLVCAPARGRHCAT